MRASEAALDRAMIRQLARRAMVRPQAVASVLAGREVWPDTYDRVIEAAYDLDVTAMPLPAPRAPRRPPPVDVDAVVAEAVAEWEGVSRGQTARIEELQAIIVGLRAKVAELEAAEKPAPVAAVAPPAAKQVPVPRLASVPKERILTIEMPDGTIATG